MKKGIIFALFLMAMLPVSVSAIPVEYSAIGTVSYTVAPNETLEVNLKGNITFESEPRIGCCEPYYHIWYDVLNYHLYTIYDNWIGNAGFIELDVEFQEWGGGTLFLPPYTQQTSPSLEFLAADGTNLGHSLDIALMLPPQIAWTSGSELVSESGFMWPIQAKVLFTKTVSSSVPEPNSLALLGLSLAGLSFCRRKKV